MLVILYGLLWSPVPGRGQVTVDWMKEPGGVSVAGDWRGNVHTVRYDQNPAGDIRLIKHDAAGVPQWEAGFDQTDPSKWERAS